MDMKRKENSGRSCWTIELALARGFAGASTNGSLYTNRDHICVRYCNIEWVSKDFLKLHKLGRVNGFVTTFPVFVIGSSENERKRNCRNRDILIRHIVNGA